ncbi:MAG: UDP-N-acetylmuramate dehydrogenase [Elusimicrobia bacterium]|nr:UDP-N-acetylmuramate dehydrogenase [Elusimicrobiota bacterium]
MVKIEYGRKSRVAKRSVSWIKELERGGLSPRRNEPLANHTSFRIGGPADAFVVAANAAQAAAALAIARAAGVPVFFLGRGSNLLVRDGGVRGLTLTLGGDFEKIEFPGPDLVRAGAAARVPRLVTSCAERGLSGLEPIVGVPGAVGGALVMNAGTREGEIGTFVEEVETLDEGGKPSAIPRRSLRFGYRSSNLGKSLILSALLRLKRGVKADIMAVVARQQRKRLQTQPIHTFNVGSTFKNPAGRFAAQMIEQSGLKGHAVGGARVSPMHANFIENFAGAKASDVLALVDLISERVRAAHGVELELEMRVVGE